MRANGKTPRRLIAHLLKAKKRELRVLVLYRYSTGFDFVVDLNGQTLKLNWPPEDFVKG